MCVGFRLTRSRALFYSSCSLMYRRLFGPAINFELQSFRDGLTDNLPALLYITLIPVVELFTSVKSD